MVDRMSVGVQSFDDGLLRQMCRYDKYGSARQIRERIERCVQEGWFRTLNVDMIFNFPAQTEEMLFRDVSIIQQCGCNQVTFYPLMASPSVQESLKETVGVVDSSREQRFYEILCRELTRDGVFAQASAWAFNREESAMIDEYVVDYEEYVAAGSGGMSFVGRKLLVNTFGLKEYREKILSGRRSVSGYLTFSRRDHMRYRLMMQLFGLKLDKKTWKRDFGCSVPAGLPAEYFFLKCAGALQETDSYITLTEKGRYLLLAMMRQFFIGVNTVRDRERDKLCQN
jgi:coproporphyrinogen III oxidase-like Fe-S oxidoreductase